MAVRMNTANTSRRREASCRVRRAMVSMAIRCPSQQLQKSIFQRLAAWLDRVDAHTRSDQGGDQIRNLIRIDAAQRIPLLFRVPCAKAIQRRLSIRGEPGKTEPDRGSGPPQLVN